MAVSRAQRQPSGSHHRRLATFLYRCPRALLRSAARQQCPALLTQKRSLLGFSVSFDQAPKESTSPSCRQRSSGKGGPEASPSAGAAQLTAAIRACSSPGELIELYRRHGAQFAPAHAHLALNRLVDVTPSPASKDLEPSPRDVANRDGSMAQGQAGAPARGTAKLTGRLRVHQGQEFAHPPLHVASPAAAAAPALPPAAAAAAQPQDPHASYQHSARRESNYLASTSSPSPALAPSRRGGGGGKSHKTRSQAVDQHPQTQLQQQLSTAAGISDLKDSAGAGEAARGSVVAVATPPPAEASSPPPPPTRREVVSMVSGLVAILLHACNRLDGWDVAESARALSRLRYMNAALLRRLEQRAVKLMAAGPCSSSSPCSSGQRGGCVPASQPAAAATAAVDSRQKGRRKPRNAPRKGKQGTTEPTADGGLGAKELFVMVSAFGAMGHRPSPAWLAAVIRATQPHLSAYAASPSGRLPLLLSSLGDFGASPPAQWLQTACAAARPRLASCPPPQLRALVASLAAMKHHPGDPWLDEYLAASERLLPDYTPWELVSTMTSLASLRVTPGEGWMERFYGSVAATIGMAGGLTGPLAAVLLSSLSQLRCRPAGDWLTLLLLGTRRSLADASGKELTDVLVALARLRFRPPEPWLQHYFTASLQRLPFQTSEQCCAAAVALTTLGRRPQPLWLQELGRHMGRQLALMPAGQQATALAALVELGYVPSGGWLEAYEKQSNGRLREASAGELCRALTALAKVGFRPQASWLYAFIMAAYSKLDAFDSAQLALIFDRLPALTPHGSWLDEIIQICAAEAAMKSSALTATQQRQQQQRSMLHAQQLLRQQEQQTESQLASQLQPQRVRPQVQLEREEGVVVAVCGDRKEALASLRPPQAAAAEASEVLFTASTPLSVAPEAAAAVQAESGAVGLEAVTAGAQVGPAVTSFTAEPVPTTTLLADDGSAITTAADVVAPGVDSSSVAVAVAAVATGVLPVPGTVAGGARMGHPGPPEGSPACDPPAVGKLSGGATIAISSELVPAAGCVLWAAAPYGGTAEHMNGPGTNVAGINGAGLKGMSLGVSLCGAEGREGEEEDARTRLALGGLVGGTEGVVAAPLELLQPMSQEETEERFVIEPSAAAGAAMALAGLSYGSSSNASVGSSSENGNGGGAAARVMGAGNSAGPAAEARRSRSRADGPGSSGGGGDGGAPSGRGDGGGSSGRDWDEEMLDVDGPRPSGSANANSRPPDVGLLKRPRVARAPVTAAVFASASSSSSRPLPLSSPLSSATQGGVSTAAVMSLFPVSGPELGGTAPTAAAPDSAPAAILQPKPRPPSAAAAAQSINAMGLAAPAGPAAAGPDALSSADTTTTATAVSTAGAAKAISPLLPFGSAAAQEVQSRRAAPAAAAATASTAAITTAAAAATTAATPAEGRVQYLDIESLSRLMGPPDGPPGPDFSSCQKRVSVGARKAGAAQSRAGGGGPFILGRIRSNEAGGGGGSFLSGPLPSHSG